MLQAVLRIAAVAGAVLGFAAGAGAQAQGPQGLDRISHILVLYMENRSFDNMFGEFPGANGIANAGEGSIQRDRDDKPFDMLPAVDKPFNIAKNSPELREMALLENLPNKPFAIEGIRPGVTTATH